MRTKWFDRKFPALTDNGLLPGIIERLDGTAARLYYKTGKLDAATLSASSETGWSIKKEVGHLTDLEPLWLRRVEELVSGVPELAAADLTNAKTNETPHDEREMMDLLQDFFQQRFQLVTRLRELTDDDLEKSSLHPRLQVPMRIIDLAYFVAEHDDHHLARITELIEADKSWMTENTL